MTTPSTKPFAEKLTPSSTILLAEEDFEILQLLKAYLTSLGYEVLTTLSGLEAVDIARKRKPDLIILETKLPGLDGFEVCRLIKSDEVTREISILFLTARDDIDDKVKAFNAGASDFLAKPFSPRELEVRIKAVLHNKQITSIKDVAEDHPVPPAIRNARDPYRLTGNVLANKYRLLGYAGGGGMGAVYLAADLIHKNNVAIKILKPDIAARNPDYSELFEKEVKNAQRLKHPNIVQVIDSGNDDDIAFMVMEWIEGQSIEDVVAQEQLPLNRISNIFEQTCSAVACAHESNIIHLDIKPANILLLEQRKPTDFVKVIDFGLSRIISKESGTTVTRFRGTHQFCAPEQFGGKVSYRSDIYSLGATLYHLISGVVPFSSSYINAKMHPNLELPQISSLTNYRDLPPEIDHVISKALNKDPYLRQNSAGQLFEEFSEAISPKI